MNSQLISAILTVLLMAGMQGSTHAQLILTGIFDGPLSGGTPKGIELYAAQDIADLSVFAVGSANNGGGTDGEEYFFPEEAASAGDFLYVASEAVEFENFFGFPPNYTSGGVIINGDDAIELFREGRVIDVFGEIDVDGTGQPWEYADGWAYRSDASGPDGTSFVMDHWRFSGPDALDDQPSNSVGQFPVPIGSYVAAESIVVLQAGDADQDRDFDQLDLVKVQVAGKYLTGQSATWGEGDWNGAPGGEPGAPPPGNGQFDQLDIVAALNAAIYLSGPYGALSRQGQTNDGQTTVGYNAHTGEVWIDPPIGIELTSINLDSAAGIFTADPAQNLGGSFDIDANHNIFKVTFGSSFGSISFGDVAQTALSEDFVLDDLSVVGSLAGGGDLGGVDLIYVPEPSTVLLFALAVAWFACPGRPRGCVELAHPGHLPV